jgi:ketosteroid isomerase-like protein
MYAAACKRLGRRRRLDGILRSVQDARPASRPTTTQEDGLSANRDVAWAYFERLNEGRMDDALALLGDDGTWWNSLQRATTPMPRVKAATPEVLRIVPMQFTLLASVEEGDVVCLEIESHATTPDGRPYNNVYCYLMTVRDGKIVRVREHADTHHALEVLPPELWEHENSSYA